MIYLCKLEGNIQIKPQSQTLLQAMDYYINQQAQIYYISVPL